jgi:hypothetical protein
VTGAVRSKHMAVLAAIALVVLSAVGLRLSEPNDRFQVISGVTGKPVKINNGELTVNQMRVGTFLSEYGGISDRTPGMFVAINVTGAATGPRPLKLDAAKLLSEDLRYDNYKIGGGINAQPGFAVTADVIFEVDPGQIDDLTLEMWPNEIISGYQQHVRIKLGVTAADAGQWRAAAAEHGIEVSEGTTRAIP